MSLSINVANNLKEDQNSFWKTNEVETKESKNSGTFFAGNLNQETDLKSRIEQRRQLAQNQAMKLVQNAWDSDQKISDGKAGGAGLQGGYVYGICTGQYGQGDHAGQFGAF